MTPDEIRARFEKQTDAENNAWIDEAVFGLLPPGTYSDCSFWNPSDADSAELYKRLCTPPASAIGEDGCVAWVKALGKYIARRHAGYLNDWNSMGELIAVLREKGWGIHTLTDPDGPPVATLSIWRGEETKARVVTEEADTLPRAVALAALIAMESET